VSQDFFVRSRFVTLLLVSRSLIHASRFWDSWPEFLYLSQAVQNLARTIPFLDGLFSSPRRKTALSPTENCLALVFFVSYDEESSYRTCGEDASYILLSDTLINGQLSLNPAPPAGHIMQTSFLHVLKRLGHEIKFKYFHKNG
jgi:hypothetical protein